MKLSMAEYKKQRQEAKDRLLDLVKYHFETNSHLKQKQIAKILGVTPARISQIKKELQKTP